MYDIKKKYIKKLLIKKINENNNPFKDFFFIVKKTSKNTKVNKIGPLKA
tara:strand:- start:486 stop:632 length:147 start_codon:yes stop_codon:yes gene_type:complete